MALEIEDLAALPDEHKDRYKALESVFGSEGWKWIQAWAQANADNKAARQLNAQSWEQNRVEYGARFAYLHLLGLEQEVDNEYLAFIEERKAALAQESADGNEE